MEAIANYTNDGEEDDENAEQYPEEYANQSEQPVRLNDSLMAIQHHDYHTDSPNRSQSPYHSRSRSRSPREQSPHKATDRNEENIGQKGETHKSSEPETEELTPEQEEMMKIMGFSNFESSKRPFELNLEEDEEGYESRQPSAGFRGRGRGGFRGRGGGGDRRDHDRERDRDRGYSSRDRDCDSSRRERGYNRDDRRHDERRDDYRDRRRDDRYERDSRRDDRRSDDRRDHRDRDRDRRSDRRYSDRSDRDSNGAHANYGQDY